MRYPILLVIVCVNFVWCIYNTERSKGTPLIYSLTENNTNSEIKVQDSLAKVSLSDSKEDEEKQRQEKNIQENTNFKKGLIGDGRPVIIDDQTIDTFNNYPSKKIGGTQKSAMSVFFEKMSMFQMIMQASMEAIESRIASLESSVTIPESTEETMPISVKEEAIQGVKAETGPVAVKETTPIEVESETMPVSIKEEEIPMELKSEKMPVAVNEKTYVNEATKVVMRNSNVATSREVSDKISGRVTDSKDADCEELPKSAGEPPERFVFEPLVDSPHSKRKDDFEEGNEAFTPPRSWPTYKASPERSNQVPTRKNKKDTISKPKKKASLNNSWISQTSSNLNINEEYDDHGADDVNNLKAVNQLNEQPDEEWRNVNINREYDDYSSDSVQNLKTTNQLYEQPEDDKRLYFDTDQSSWPEKTIDIPITETNLEDAWSGRKGTFEDSWTNPSYSSPQTPNNPHTLDRTAFEVDRSRENPRLQYQTMKLQRRLSYHSMPKETDYECIDDDGIDCPTVTQDDDDQARNLDELTKKDNFQARVFDSDFDWDDELLDIEKAEKKLEELVRETAMNEELKKLLKILDNFKPGCPYNIPSVKIGNRCYSVERSHLTFQDAHQFCKARGGTLAQDPINAFLWSQIIKAYPDHDAEPMWVGASDEYGRGSFNFFNGKEVIPSDSRWHSNYPTASGNRRCMCVDSHNHLHFKDTNCDKKHRFICEYPLVSLI